MPLKRLTRPSAAQFLERHAKAAMVRQVRAIFNDASQGERPVRRSDDALFAPDSAIWRVHGDVTTMMVGGVSALLLQMLHPAVLAGVWDHSNFRHDMLGRLRRTARFIAVTTYGAREDAEAAIAQVRDVHDHVAGTLPDGTHYRASDPALLAWVHVAEAVSFLAAWQRYGDRPLPPTGRDAYFAEFARIGEAVGAAPVPRSRAEAERAIEAMRGDLRCDSRTREVARMLLAGDSRYPLMMPVRAVTFQAAADLLPPWAQRMHGMRGTTLVRPLAAIGTSGVARALRWAFR